MRDKPTSSIDEGLQTTIENIKTASEESIPKYIVKPRPFIPLSSKFECLTRVLNKLLIARTKTKEKSTIKHINKQRRYVVVLLREEGKALASEHWKNLMQETDSLRTSNSKKYWQRMKRFMGHRRDPISITENGQPNGKRLKSDTEIEKHMRAAWQDNFTPTPNEKIHSDTRN